MRASRLVTWYSIFAGLSIATNIGAQIASMAIYSGNFAIALSMVVGTGAGLVVKYILDKRFIFKHQTKSAAHEARTFILYSAMGLATTAIFWGTELAFEHLFSSDLMRYVGGIIGLSVGYTIKYFLDKSLVFNFFTAILRASISA